MNITEENIAQVRSGLMTLAGLSCLIYALMAVAQNDPQPFWWFVPGAMGVFAAIGTFAVFTAATPEVRRMANDEMYRQTAYRAQRHAFWFALAMYPFFAVLVAAIGLYWNTAFAAMGTLTGAAYLLLLAVYEWRQG